MKLLKFGVLLFLVLTNLKLNGGEIVLQPIGNMGTDLIPVLEYNEDSQEFTIDFGEVDEISSGRVVIHDDSGGYQVHKWIDKRPVCVYEQPRQHKTAQDGQQIRGLIK